MDFSVGTVVSSIIENIHDQEDCYYYSREICILINAGLINDNNLLSENVIEALLTVIATHPLNPRVLKMAMLSIVFLTVTSKEARRKFVSLNGEELLISALELNPEDPEISAQASNLFGNVVCPSVGYNYESPRLPDVVRTVIDRANSFPWSPEIAINTTIMMANAACNSRSRQITLRKLGAIEAVITIMARFKDNPTVQQKGCFALGNLSGDSPENRREIGRKGGIRALVRAMRDHPDNVRVQDYAIYAIGNSCCNSKYNSSLFRELGGLEIAVEMFRRYKSDTSYLSYAPNGLGNLSGDVKENKITMCTLGLIDLLVEAIVESNEMNTCRSCSRAIEFMLACDETYDRWMSFKVKTAIENAFRRYPTCLSLENSLNAVNRQVHPLVREAIEEGVCTRTKVHCEDQCPSNKYNYYCPKCCVPQYTYHCLTCYDKYSRCVRLCETCFKRHPKDHKFMKVFMSRRCANEPIYKEDLIDVRSLCAINGYDVDYNSDDDDNDDNDDDSDLDNDGEL